MYIVLIVVSRIENREDPKGTSQSSLKHPEGSTEQSSTAIPVSKRTPGRIPPLEPLKRDNHLYRRSDGVGGNADDDMVPLVSNHTQRRQLRPDDVNASANLPSYNRLNDKEYRLPTKKRRGPGESGDAGYYAGHSPEHEQPLPYVEDSAYVSFVLSGPVVARFTRFIFICALTP